MSLKTKIEKVCNELNSFISEKNNFNDDKTRLFVKNDIELRLNFLNKNVNITDINVKCDEENNPSSIIEMCCLIAQINWKENYQQYYLIFPFGTKENYENLINKISSI
jgi:hypothetical protein